MMPPSKNDGIPMFRAIQTRAELEAFLSGKYRYPATKRVLRQKRTYHLRSSLRPSSAEPPSDHRPSDIIAISSDSEIVTESVKLGLTCPTFDQILIESSSGGGEDSGIVVSSSVGTLPFVGSKSRPFRRARSLSLTGLPLSGTSPVLVGHGLDSDVEALDVDLDSQSNADTILLEDEPGPGPLPGRDQLHSAPPPTTIIPPDELDQPCDNPFTVTRQSGSDIALIESLQDNQLEDSDDPEILNLLTELSGFDSTHCVKSFSAGVDSAVATSPADLLPVSTGGKPISVDSIDHPPVEISTDPIGITSFESTKKDLQDEHSTFLTPILTDATPPSDPIVVVSDEPERRCARPTFSKALMSAAFITSSDDFGDGPAPRKRHSKRSRKSLMVSSEDEERHGDNSDHDVTLDDAGMDPSTHLSADMNRDGDVEPATKKSKKAPKKAKAGKAVAKKEEDGALAAVPKKKTFRSSFGKSTKKAALKKKPSKPLPKVSSTKSEDADDEVTEDREINDTEKTVTEEANTSAMDVDEQKQAPETTNTSENTKSTTEHPKKPETFNMAQFFKTKSDSSKDNGTQPSGTLFADLCAVFADIEATTKRLEITAMLTDMYKKIMEESPDDLIPAIYMCVNRLGAEYEAPELGVGEGMLIKAIAEATGRTLEKVKGDLKTHGDLGLVAQHSKGTQKSLGQLKKLTISSVFQNLWQIARFSGSASASKKLGKIKFMIASCKGDEVKYLIRILQGKLRIGLAEQTVLVSLAQASAYVAADKDGSVTTPDLAGAAQILKGCFSEVPSYDYIVPLIREFGIFDMRERCRIQPGIPVKPMLAHPSKSIVEVLNRFEGLTFSSEFKYDGERSQIHYTQDGNIRIFSRNMEDLSVKYPDIVKRVPSFMKEGTMSFVLDCECVAYDAVEKAILPFQVLSTRKRKDVLQEDIKVQVVLFAFDCLYLNGESLLSLPFEERLERMNEHFSEETGSFEFAKRQICKSSEDIQLFLDEAVQNKCEGLMIKTMGEDSTYEPSQRSRSWLKLKKDYLDSSTTLGDSLDLVVIGGYHGKGKRAGWYGGFLLAIYDKEAQEYQAVAKIGTGFSEEFLKTAKEFFDEQIVTTKKEYYRVTDTIKPDVWFEACQVWEVKAADLSLSPIYPAGQGTVDESKGISLRFPRFIRIRNDKAPEEATSPRQLAIMYKSQDSVGGEQQPVKKRPQMHVLDDEDEDMGDAENGDHVGNSEVDEIEEE